MKPLLVCGMVAGIVCGITYTWAGTATAQTPDPAQEPDSAEYSMNWVQFSVRSRLEAI